MTSSRVRPEYGPTLPGLIAPRVARLSPPMQRLVRAGAVAVVVLAALAGILWPRAHGFSHGGRAAFDLRYSRALHRVAPDAGGILRVVQTRRGRLMQSFAVDPLTLPPYAGDPFGELPAYASRYIQGLATRFTHFRLLGEGKTRVNGNAGYTILYTGRLDGHALAGRDDFFIADRDGWRDGIAIEMLTSHTSSPSLIGTTGAIGDTLQSLNLG